jgi:hypothetical protein
MNLSQTEEWWECFPSVEGQTYAIHQAAGFVENGFQTAQKNES